LTLALKYDSKTSLKLAKIIFKSPKCQGNK